MEVKIRTLTPLWTGGVDGSMDRIHETGIIGSMRWWYEAIVRGLGGHACDPTEHGCTFDEEKYRKSKASDERQRLCDAGVCDACQLFGTTGWARKFRLKVSDGEKSFDGQNILIPSGRVHPSRRGLRAGGWFVFSESRIGEIEFEIIPLRNVDLTPIHTILALISRYASLGPKGANGYGVIQAQNIQPVLNRLQNFPVSPKERNHTLPDFRDFFFARFQFNEPNNGSRWWQAIEGIRQAYQGQLDDGSKPSPLRDASREIQAIYKAGILPIAPAIRNWLRYTWQHGLNRLLEEYVFGDARSAIGSKILVSHAYRMNDGKWEFRIWGWLPCNGKIQERDKFLDSLKIVLTEKNIWQNVFGNTRIIPGLVEWHTLDCQETNGVGYLQELLGGGAA